MTAKFSVEHLSPHVMRLAVPTLTLPPLDSTNTYVIHSHGTAIVVDCGSDDDDVVQQVATHLTEQGILRVQAYIATHYHLDHTRGLGRLAKHFPAPFFSHPIDARQAALEIGCLPDDILPAISTMTVGDVRVELLHQPGHTHGHLHLHVLPDNLLLVGDHMAGTGTVWIGPPDGHMADYYDALRQIRDSGASLVLPGHGDPIPNSHEAAATLLAHRLSREADIIKLLQDKSRQLDEIVQALYGDRGLGAALWVAKHTTQAHLAHLIDLGDIQRRCVAPDFLMRYEILEREADNA